MSCTGTGGGDPDMGPTPHGGPHTEPGGGLDAFRTNLALQLVVRWLQERRV